MSLHFLGLRDFSGLHRELTSSVSQIPKIKSAESVEEFVQDSKDVLVQRLRDLTKHLQEENLPDEALSTLHHDVTHMERTLNKATHSKPPLQKPLLRSFASSMSLLSNGSHQDDAFWRPGSPVLSALESPFRFHSPSAPASTSKLPEPARAAPSAIRCAILAHEADALLAKLVKVVGELKSRREESEVGKHRRQSSCIFCISALNTSTDISQHIHDLLITRAEKAAQRVTELEDRIADLDGDYEETQSELNYLRIQMRAIEVQASEHMEWSQDEELTQSIQSWKEQWVEVDKGVRERRKKCVETPTKGSPRRMINFV